MHDMASREQPLERLPVMSQKKQIFLAFLFSSLSIQSFAFGTQLSEENLKSYLKTDPVYFTKGEFKGQMIDQSLKRPVQFIPELETVDSYFISNFYNQKQFWVAEIPKAAVKDVIFQLALFKGPLVFTLAHAQFRFLLNEPVKLYRFADGQLKTTRTADLIFTVQAALPAGKSYDAKLAFMGAYKLVARLSNTFDRVSIEEVNQGDIVTQYLLQDLSSEQKDILLFNSVKFSNDNLLKNDYVATTQNCISAAFDIIDQTLENSKGRVTLTLQNTLFNGQSPNEKMALDALRDRKLIGEKSRLENWR
jgi:hypothetical protein